MRIMLLVAVSLTLAACGEQAAPAPAAAASMEAPMVAESAPVTDANAMTIEQLNALLLGAWRATDDEKATLVIAADGKWTSVYEGDTLFVADWKLFTGDQPPAGAAGPFTPASRYLEVKEAIGAFYYELGHVADDGFDMFYTARGNNLSFARVK